MIALIDMDGVLCDFVGGVARLFDVDADALREADAASPKGGVEQGLGVSATQFWKRLDGAGPGFWADLEPFADALEVWRELVAMEHVHAYVCSTPSKCVTSPAGKLAWMQKHLGGRDFQDYFLTKHKHHLAHASRPSCLLVDDSPPTCSAFAFAGGETVLMPRHGERSEAWGRVLSWARFWNAR